MYTGVVQTLVHISLIYLTAYEWKSTPCINGHSPLPSPSLLWRGVTLLAGARGPTGAREVGAAAPGGDAVIGRAQARRAPLDASPATWCLWKREAGLLWTPLLPFCLVRPLQGPQFPKGTPITQGCCMGTIPLRVDLLHSASLQHNLVMNRYFMYLFCPSLKIYEVTGSPQYFARKFTENRLNEGEHSSSLPLSESSPKTRQRARIWTRVDSDVEGEHLRATRINFHSQSTRRLNKHSEGEGLRCRHRRHRRHMDDLAASELWMSGNHSVSTKPFRYTKLPHPCSVVMKT